jgi:hypothetical protein
MAWNRRFATGRLTAPRTLRWGAVVLAAAVLGLIACSEYGFMDDFPPYPPTEPYLEEQELQRKRVLALREEERRRKNRFESESREAALAEWRRLEAQQRRGVERLRMEQERREGLPRYRGVDPEKLDEWERIVR